MSWGTVNNQNPQKAIQQCNKCNKGRQGKWGTKGNVQACKNKIKVCSNKVVGTGVGVRIQRSYQMGIVQYQIKRANGTNVTWGPSCNPGQMSYQTIHGVAARPWSGNTISRPGNTNKAVHHRPQWGNASTSFTTVTVRGVQ